MKISISGLLVLCVLQSWTLSFQSTDAFGIMIYIYVVPSFPMCKCYRLSDSNETLYLHIIIIAPKARS